MQSETDERTFLGQTAASVWASIRSERVEALKTNISFIDELTLDSSSSAGGAGLVAGIVMETYGYSGDDDDDDHEDGEEDILDHGCGKTELALNIVASWVMPRHLGGFESTAVFVDLDVRLNVARLFALLRSKAAECGAQGSEQTAIAEAGLRRVVLARCFDELELLSMLEKLKRDVSSGARRPVLLVLDSLGSLYYSRKFLEGCGSGPACLLEPISRAIETMVARKALAVVACKPCVLPPQRVDHDEGPSLQHRYVWCCGALPVYPPISAPSSPPQLDEGKSHRGLTVRITGIPHHVRVSSPSAVYLHEPEYIYREYMGQTWEKLVTHRITLMKEDAVAPQVGQSSAPPISAFTARVTRLRGRRSSSHARFIVDKGGLYAIEPEVDQEGDVGIAE